MRELAAYAMRGRWQAIVLALLFAVIPFLGWFGQAIMALVTLRKGAKEGALVLLWVSLPSLVAGFVGYPELWLYDVIGGSLITYLFAVALRHTARWSSFLQLGILLGVLVVLGVHIWKPDIIQIWAKELPDYLTNFSQRLGIDADPTIIQQTANRFTAVMTGIQVAFVLIADIFNIWIARWMQASLYNPQGLTKELRNIRLGWFAIIILAVMLILALAGASFAIDAMPVVVLPFVAAGLSVVHSFAEKRNIPKSGLIVFYALLILFFIYLAVLLTIVALLDCWLDLRQRFGLIANK